MIGTIVVCIFLLFPYANTEPVATNSIVKLTVRIKVTLYHLRLQPYCTGLILSKNFTFVDRLEVFRGIITAGQCCDVSKSIGFHRRVAEAHDRYIRPFPPQLPEELRWRLLFGHITVESAVNNTVKMDSNVMNPVAFLSQPAAYRGNLQGVCVLDISHLPDNPTFDYEQLNATGCSFRQVRDSDKTTITTTTTTNSLLDLYPAMVVSYSICETQFKLGSADAPEQKGPICVELCHPNLTCELPLPVLGAVLYCNHPTDTSNNAIPVGVVTAIAPGYRETSHPLMLVTSNRQIYQFYSRVAHWSKKHSDELFQMPW